MASSYLVDTSKWPIPVRKYRLQIKEDLGRAVVESQLVEQSLPTPEIRGANLNIGKVLSTNCNLIEKYENKEKKAGNGPS